MNTYGKWVLALALAGSFAVNVLQAGRSGWLARPVGQSDRAAQEAEAFRIKSLEKVVRDQRLMLIRFQLQLNALGNPPLPAISAEEVERVDNDAVAVPRTAR